MFFYVLLTPLLHPTQDMDPQYWVSAQTEELAKEKAAKKFGVDVGDITLTRGNCSDTMTL